LGTADGWVRGWWPVSFGADEPTGACQLAASFGEVSVSEPLTQPQDQTVWHQCPAATFSQSFNTASVASGSNVPLVMWARDAAYDSSTGTYRAAADTRYVNVDHDPVEVNVSGPADAPTSTGTQYIDATASSGPSGVCGILCSVDRAPAAWYPSSSVQVPVSGLGQHTMQLRRGKQCRG
jgi:hypothetical protein